MKKPVDKKKKGTETADPGAQAPTIDAQPLTSPPSIKFKIHKNSTSAAHAELSETRRDNDEETHLDDDQEELMTYVLTEDIFVEILSARLQVMHRSDALFPSHLDFRELIVSMVLSSMVSIPRS